VRGVQRFLVITAREIINAITHGVKDQQLVLTPELVVRDSTATARATRSKRV
jgi:hypothetical protein